jgi:hypothetical protein
MPQARPSSRLDNDAVGWKLNIACGSIFCSLLGGNHSSSLDFCNRRHLKKSPNISTRLLSFGALGYSHLGRLIYTRRKACIDFHLRLFLALATYLGVLSACVLSSSLSCLPDNPHDQMMQRAVEGLVPFVRSVGRVLVRNHDHYPTCPALSPGLRPVHEDGSSSTR